MGIFTGQSKFLKVYRHDIERISLWAYLTHPRRRMTTGLSAHQRDNQNDSSLSLSLFSRPGRFFSSRVYGKSGKVIIATKDEECFLLRAGARNAWGRRMGARALLDIYIGGERKREREERKRREKRDGMKRKEMERREFVLE